MAILYIKSGWVFIPINTIKGADGITPHIGENGHWYIGTTDTGVSATPTTDMTTATVTFTEASTKANVVSGAASNVFVKYE